MTFEFKLNKIRKNIESLMLNHLNVYKLITEYHK